MRHGPALRQRWPTTSSRSRSSRPTSRTPPTTTWPGPGRCSTASRAEAVADRKILDAAMEPVAADVVAARQGRRRRRALPAARHRADGAARRRGVILGTQPGGRGGGRVHRPAASPIRRGAGSSRRRARRWRRSRGAPACRSRRSVAASRRSAATSSTCRGWRVLHNWIDTQDAGWARYTLDRAKVPYTLINDDDLKRGEPRRALRRHPLSQDHGGDLPTWCTGSIPSTARSPTPRPPEFPSQGIPDASEDITGGMGFAGAAQPRQVRPRRRRADRPRQRRHAAGRRRHRARRLQRAAGRQHAGLGAAGQGGAAGASAGLRLRGADPGLPRQRPGLRRAEGGAGAGACCSSAPRSPTGRSEEDGRRSRARPPGSRWRISTLRRPRPGGEAESGEEGRPLRALGARPRAGRARRQAGDPRRPDRARGG